MTAYYIDNQGIYTSDKRFISKDIGCGLLAWLISDTPKENKLLYDLDACVASLIKNTLSESQARELYENERVWVDGFKLTYFPTRFFAIDYGKQFVNFGNMIRYKSDVHYSPDDTLEDKINKAKEADAIAQSASEILGNLGLDKQKIISPVSALVDKYIKPLNIPTIDDVPEDAGELAYKTIKGNWLESYQLGYWDTAYDYDINMAYGSVLARLLDTRRGTWVEDKSMPDKAVYGFAEGTLEITSPFHPCLLAVDDKHTFTPSGYRVDHLDKGTIDLIRKNKLGTFDIQKGWWWIPSETRPPYQPLKGIVSHLYNIRFKSEGLKRAIIRQMVAGIWGRLIEIRKQELGELVNTVWASIVENGIKCQVTDTCLSAGIMPLQVAVDGVITETPLPVKDTLDIGGWRLSHKGKCIIASSGIVGFEGKEGAEEFALKYEWLESQLRENPKQTEYTMIKYSPVTLAKAMQNKNFNKLGALEKSERKIIIGRDYKRLWKSYPQNGGDLLNNKYVSSPIDVVMAQSAYNE